MDNLNGFDALENEIIKISDSCFFTSQDKQNIIIEGWEKAVEKVVDSETLNKSASDWLGGFIKYFSLSNRELDKNGWLTKVAKIEILQEIYDGRIPEIKTYGDLPVNLLKNERIVWAFESSKYYEDKIKNHYIGRTQGVSVRIMKWIYCRSGTFKGHIVEQTSRVHIDNGWVIITDKNIYFAGQNKSLRLP